MNVRNYRVRLPHRWSFPNRGHSLHAIFRNRVHTVTARRYHEAFVKALAPVDIGVIVQFRYTIFESSSGGPITAQKERSDIPMLLATHVLPFCSCITITPIGYRWKRVQQIVCAISVFNHAGFVEPLRRLRVDFYEDPSSVKSP